VKLNEQGAVCSPKLVIFRYQGMYVFDDERVGLVQETFILIGRLAALKVLFVVLHDKDCL